MAINSNPLYTPGQNLTREQLDQIMGLVKDKPRTSTHYGQTESDFGQETQVPIWARLSADKFSPEINWNREQTTRFEGDNDYTTVDPSAGNFRITQPRNISTWGNSDTIDSWNEDGTYAGATQNAADIRGIANMAAIVAGGAYAGSAAGGAGAAGTETVSLGGLGDFTVADLAMGNEMASSAASLGPVGGFGTTASTVAGAQNTLSNSNTAANGGTSGTWNGTDFSGPASSGGDTLLDAAGNVVKNVVTDPNVIKAGVTLAGSALADKSGDSSVADLSQVNPAQLYSIQNAIGQQNANNQLDAARYNTVTADGSSTWSKTPQFNQAGYDSAMQAWQAAGNANLPQPTREQFTSQQWTNTSSLSPDAQKLADRQRANQQGAADAFGAQGVNYSNITNAGANRSGIPDYQYGVGQKAPGYDKISAPAGMGGATYGDITRGDIRSDVATTARDWAGRASPMVDDWSQQLANLDPFLFDQQGSDAMWNVSSRYMLPQQAAEKQAMEARLGEQGFVPGTPAYESALKQMLDSQGLAQADARDRALLAGREFGDQAFDNKSGALNSAIAAQLGLGELGLGTDKLSFDQNLAQANFANEAQAQDFSQQNTLSEQQFQEGLSANQVVKDLFGMNLDATTSNNKWSSQNYQDLLDGAKLNNDAVTSAGNMANKNYTTDVEAQRNITKDFFDMQGDRPVAPGASQSNVPGAANPDLAQMLQQYFGNNVDLANADTSADNAKLAAFAQVLAAMFGG